MPIDERLIGRRLADYAAQAPPPRTAAEHVRGRIRRRRRTRAAIAAAAGSAAALGAVAVVWSGVASSGSGRQVGAGGGPVPHCGDRITQPVIRQGRDGFALTIRSVTRTAGGAPQVTADITAGKNVRVFMPVGAYRPRLLVLRDGIIVAGQDDHPLETFNMPGGGQIVGPAHPYPQVVSPATKMPCPPYTWDRLWAGKEKYSLVVLMKAYPSQMATKRTWDAVHGAWVSDQYLIAQAPFTVR